MTIDFRESGGTGPSSNLGGVIQATSVSEVAGDWFNNVDSIEAAAGSVKYRCCYIQNNEATTLVSGAYVITTNTPSGDTDVEIALGSSAVNGVEPTVANEDTAPSGPVFGVSDLTLPDIPAGQHKAVWWKRTVIADAAPAAGDNALTTASGEV